MSADPIRVDEVLVSERELWMDGPPHELFKQLRHECPVHWTAKITEYPPETGDRAVAGPEAGHEVSRVWATFSPHRGGITAVPKAVFPLELVQAMFIGMDPPKHDRLKALFQSGFTPKRIAEHEEEIRAITAEVLDRLDGRETADLVFDVAHLLSSRVIRCSM